jgi:hypothetical protein
MSNMTCCRSQVHGLLLLKRVLICCLGLVGEGLGACLDLLLM